MKQTILVIFCLGLCVGLGFGKLKATTLEADQKFSDQVNLALRQVGHQLLKLAGDERSTIPPVQITGPGEFTLKLERSFNYDTLPHLLNQAFLSYEIQRDYQVAVKHCNNNALILGYNLTAFAQGKVPCIGREQWSECNNIVLTFAAPAGLLIERQGLLIPFFILTSLAIIGFGIFWIKNKATVGSSVESGSNISLGNFSFDYQNQTLQLGDQRKSLTFRENKLLYFLASNTNEVIKRDTLIAEIWGDEGVMVGRSLDVFISRLRKLLKGDDRVLIKNIHGVGYRLEVMGLKRD